MNRDVVWAVCSPGCGVQVQEASGHAAGGIGAGTKPIGDIAGFNSLSKIEATVANPRQAQI